MDIHRCRFVPYPVSAINAVAFTHNSLPKTKKAQKPRLAIGRANGDVEIWNPNNGAWHQELVMPGGKDRSVDGLVWVNDPDEVMTDGTIFHGKSRLFSIGYTTAITEYDLEKGRVKKHVSGQHGDIWCLGVQPPPTEADKSPRKLVAGTVDGSLLLYSLEDGDLEFSKALTKTPLKKTKMVSIAFQSRRSVVVGCSDSTIRVYDVSRGTMRAQMTLGSDHSASSTKNVIVWAVKCLPNGDIVSGDSTGHLCIWDGRSYTQTQKILGHTQDILCLAVNEDGSQIVSGGMDGRVVYYEPARRQPGRWAKVFHRRHDGHEDAHHDIKAMASLESKGMSVVVCGGSKANPIVLPLRRVGEENHRNLPSLPQAPKIRSASRARLFISWWGNEIRIWELVNPVPYLLADTTTDAEFAKNRRLIAQLLVKGESSITSAAISEDGNLLVASTDSEIKAFQLEYHPKSGYPHPELKKLKMPVTGHGASKVELSPDAKWMCWVEEGSRVMIASVSKSEERFEISKPYKLNRLARRVPKNIQLGGLGKYDRNVLHVTFSPDSRMLAVADIAGFIDTWVLRGPGAKTDTSNEIKEGSSSGDSSDEEAQQTDDDGERWTRNPKGALIFRFPSAPVVLSFSQTCLPTKEEDGDYLLLVITPQKQVFLFNPLHGCLADWSRRNPSSRLPHAFRITRDLAKGAVWQGPRVWVYGSTFVCMLDLSQDFSEDWLKNGVKSGSKRKRDAQDSGAGGKMDKHQALVSQQVKVATGPPEEVAWMEVDMAEADDSKSVGASSGVEDLDDDDDDDDDDETDGGELQRLRDSGEDAAASGDESGSRRRATTRRAKFWNTYEYQPILGIVPLQTASEDEHKQNGVSEEYPELEVALVERPT